jgi:hypothetical protein
MKQSRDCLIILSFRYFLEQQKQDPEHNKKLKIRILEQLMDPTDPETCCLQLQTTPFRNNLSICGQYFIFFHFDAKNMFETPSGLLKIFLKVF